MNWQKASGYNKRSKVEAVISRYKRVIGDVLKSRDDARRVTEVAIAVKSLNRMRDLGQAICVRVGVIDPSPSPTRASQPPCNKVAADDVIGRVEDTILLAPQKIVAADRPGSVSRSSKTIMTPAPAQAWISGGET